MRTIRIFQPGNYKVGDRIELAPAASKHVATVLRMQAGQQLILFRGDNQEFTSNIIEVNKKNVLIEILSSKYISRESPSQIHLAQAISKGDSMEFIIQKAVELGVTSITPLITKYCVVRLNSERIAKKMQQWQAIIIAACEQCGRNTIPIINPVCSLNDFINNYKDKIKFILHPYDAQPLHNYEINTREICLIIGPEGGFSEVELNFAGKNACKSLSLGPRILRTETATIAALSLLQTKIGDM